MTSSVDAGQAANGGLLVVGTPIGNLSDFSERGRGALSSVDAIICEDSRRSGRLLQQLGLPKRPFLVANDHTETRVSAEVVNRIQGGERFALITDAGMPGISDPGQRLIVAVVASGGALEIIPGPTAVVSALVLSGLETSRFVFEGFLARKGKERRLQLQDLSTQPRTTVIYESPKRVKATLIDLIGVCGQDREISVARELTKLHEQVVRGTMRTVLDHFEATDPRGEFVLVIAGCPPAPVATDEQIVALLRTELDSGSTKRDAVAAVVLSTAESKNRVYGLITHLS